MKITSIHVCKVHKGTYICKMCHELNINTTIIAGDSMNSQILSVGHVEHDFKMCIFYIIHPSTATYGLL